MFHLLLNALILLLYVLSPIHTGDVYIATGYIMNITVMAVNNGKMPVYGYGITQQYINNLEWNNFICVGDENTQLKFLSDCINTKVLIVSIGDCLIMAGLIKNYIGKDCNIVFSPPYNLSVQIRF